jgi:hypothetical protein
VPNHTALPTSKYPVLPLQGLCRLFKDTKAYAEGGEQRHGARRVIPLEAADVDSDLLHADPATLARQVRVAGLSWVVERWLSKLFSSRVAVIFWSIILSSAVYWVVDRRLVKEYIG